METLDTIGLRNLTDQSSAGHGYLPILDRFFAPFRDREIIIVEIGVAGGASLRTWREYFTQATIVGIDHNPAVLNIKFPPHINVIHGEAGFGETWKRVFNMFGHPTIINDDGGHFSHQIIPTFEAAWPLLLPGGVYVIQDLHAIYANEIAHAPDGKTAFDYFWNIMHEMNERGDGQCGKPTGSDIEWMHFSKSLLIIKKR